MIAFLNFFDLPFMIIIVTNGIISSFSSYL